jgi:hypothetical protein
MHPSKKAPPALIEPVFRALILMSSYLSAYFKAILPDRPLPPCSFALSQY